MSKHLGVEQTLELLDGLKTIVHDTAAWEDKVNQEFTLRMARVRQQTEEAIEEVRNQLTSDIGQADLACQTALESAAAKASKRSDRLVAAQRNSKKKKLLDIENQEGSCKHRLQTETLQANRNHKEGLETTERNYLEFKACLAGDEQVVAGLEASAYGAFAGYPSFRRLLQKAYEPTAADLAKDEYQLLNELRELMTKTGTDQRKFNHKPLPFLFRALWFWVVLLLLVIPLVPALQYFKINSFTYPMAIASCVGGLVLGFLLHIMSRKQATPLATQIAGAIMRVRALQVVCHEKCEHRHTSEIERIENEFVTTNQRIEQDWNNAVNEAAQMRESWPKFLDQKATRATQRHESMSQARRDRIERNHKAKVETLRQQAENRIAQLTKTSTENLTKLEADCQARWQPMEAEWKQKVHPVYEQIHQAQADATILAPPWESPEWGKWTPPSKFAHAAKIGTLHVNVKEMAESIPGDPRLALPGAADFEMPLLLTYPQQGSLLFETPSIERDEVVAVLNNIILRLLSKSPPGRLSFTIIDPVGLGQSFSGVMHLADYAEHVINSRIWTQTTQIEEKLGQLNEHMEKVIQMYLRNEYATIAEYNEQAGNIAEKYHFLVVADFPVNFSEIAAKRLMSIAASGARCGVYTLIHWDRRQPAPQDFVPEEMRKTSICVTTKGKESRFTGKYLPGITLNLDPPPSPEFAINFTHKVGLSSRDSNRIEVPFAHVAPPENEFWQLETTHELRVPIGRTGATKLQYLAIGKGTRQHGLMAGKTGSGKSTLFHVIITNLAVWCSPEQVEFYLVDFKKGVEFKCYATRRLPHARVVAIESDREFGLSVLQRLDDELKRRGDWFRKLGVQDIAGYKKAGGKEPIPRTMLIIDEFQEFFVEDDKIAQTASLLLDRIVRQGRAFGIHVLLGSQTLGGAYTVARTTLGQMVIRIALQCNEADAYLIMDDTNPAPRLLSRPGEGIYNDSAGALEGNSPFQVVWLPDEVRDKYLGKARDLADKTPHAYPGPIVFEGNAPADVKENPVLQRLLEAPALEKAPAAARIWLGAPNSIKGPTEAVFHRASGNNLLLVGQREEATLAIVSISLLALAAQYPLGTARFILLDSTPPGMTQRDYLDRVVQSIPHPVQVAKQGELGELFAGLVEEMKSRSEHEQADSPATFIIIHGIQKFNKMRYEEDFSFGGGDAGGTPNPATSLNTLITEGTRLGFHVFITCDTYNNVNRFISRKAFSEFELRILFQMSVNDSASLIDSPKASNLGMHRALFFNQQEGYLETFRPYALPGNEWLEQTAQHLSRLLKK